MRFVLAKRNRDAQNSVSDISTNAHGDQRRSVAPLPIDAHVLVAGIPQYRTAGIQRVGALLFRRGVRLRRRATDLGRGQCDAAHLLGNRRRVARRDALYGECGQRQEEDALTAQLLLQHLGMPMARRLRHVKRDLADAGHHGFEIGAVGIAAPFSAVRARNAAWRSWRRDYYQSVSMPVRRSSSGRRSAALGWGEGTIALAGTLGCLATLRSV